jgi:hypothetical protein
VWLVAAEGVEITQDPDAEKTHFGFLDAANSAKARELKG